MSDDGPFGLHEVTHEPASGRPLYFLTNRMNLNTILGSRLIAPREAYLKHYADLLDLTPRWVPLLTAAPAKEHLDIVTRERGSGSPVLVELSGDVVKAARRVSDDGVVYLHAATMADARAIHFPDERSLREHRARIYSNVHPHEDLVRVTPALFSGDGVEVEIVSPGGTPSPDWRRVDRIRGAANAVVNYAISSGRLALAAALLGETVDDPGVELPGWLTWTELDDHEHAQREGAPRSPDAVTFAAAYSVLADFDIAGSWSPGAVLNAVVERVEDVSLSDDDRALVMRNLQRVRQLVDAEVEFEPFRSTASALMSAKALILVLLRPDLGDLLAWSCSATGADEVTELVAAVFAGRLRGVAREAVELRSIQFDDATASWAVQVADDPKAVRPRIDLVWDGPQVTVASGAAPEDASPSAPVEVAVASSLVSAYSELGSRSRAAARLRVARRMGWPVTTVVKVPAGSDVALEGSAINVVGVDAVKLSDSISEQDFLALAATVASDRVDEALMALHPRRR